MALSSFRNSGLPNTNTLYIPNANFSNTATGTYSSSGINYKFVTFTGNGTLTVTTAGLADILVIGGGGPGGNHVSAVSLNFGGGGAGGYCALSNIWLPATSITITVGGGGSVGSLNGSDSSIGSIITAVGGSTGGLDRGYNPQAPGKGGSGGGGPSIGNNVRLGGPGTLNQGNTGGNGDSGGGDSGGGGGGGGAGAVGNNGTQSAGGNGGAGLASSITGTSVTRAGGGGGARLNGSGGSGGSGGGGNGQSSGGGGGVTSGTANTGSGGGGARGWDGAGSGGSGIVIVRVIV